MNLNYGGFTPVSTVDWPGHASMVLFLRGCRYRCNTCHNKDLWEGEDLRGVDEIKKIIKDNALLVSALVISGGEPFMQPEAVKEIALYAHSLDLLVGIETAGTATNGKFIKEELLDEKIVDKLFIDIKADPRKREEYAIVTNYSLAQPLLETLITFASLTNTPTEIRVVQFKDNQRTVDAAEKLSKEYGFGFRILERM